MINTDKLQFFTTEMQKMGARSVVIAWITNNGEASLFGNSSIPDSSVLTHLIQLHTTERIKLGYDPAQSTTFMGKGLSGKTNTQPNP